MGRISMKKCERRVRRHANWKLLASTKEAMNHITWQVRKATAVGKLAPPYLVREKLSGYETSDSSQTRRTLMDYAIGKSRSTSLQREGWMLLDSWIAPTGRRSDVAEFYAPWTAS